MFYSDYCRHEDKREGQQTQDTSPLVHKTFVNNNKLLIFVSL